MEEGVERPDFFAGETTPLVIDGVMYVSTPYGRVVAARPDDRKGNLGLHLPRGQAIDAGRRVLARGLADCRRKSCSARATARSISLDAKTGEPNEKFGDKGVVNLNTPEILQGLTATTV